MMQLLAGIGGGATLLLAIAFITLSFLNRKDNRETMAARDLIAAAHEENNKLRGELLLETAAHAETERLLKAEHDLRAAVEVERDDAYHTAHAHFVEQIKNSGVADAISLVNRLSPPVPVVVRKADAVIPAGDPNRTDDDLIEPGL